MSIKAIPGQMENRFTSELMRVKNSKSGKYYFYMRNAVGNFERISESAFNLKKDLAFGLECITITVTGAFVRHNVTAVYYL